LAVFAAAPAAFLPAILASIAKVAGDSRMQGFTAMIRSPGAAGFSSQSAPVASPRLIDVVAASLAFGALSLCLVVTITVFSVSMPIPA
jgi:hypothetical protein